MLDKKSLIGFDAAKKKYFKYYKMENMNLKKEYYKIKKLRSNQVIV